MLKIPDAARLLNVERLREVLDYDQETGVFRWKASRSNQKKAGDIAGSVNKRGCRSIRVDGRLYLAHRLAWLHVTGRWPDGEIDHKNTTPGNDWIVNLRDTTHGGNQQNQQRAHSNNKLGILGVCRDGGKFRAQIQVNGKLHRLGSFATPEEAHAVYVEAKRRLHEGCTI